MLRSPADIAARPLMAASAVMIRRDVALEAGAFRPLARAADLDMWLRMLERGAGYVSPRVSLLYHLHPGQVSDDATRLQSAHREVLGQCVGRPWFHPRLARDWETVMAWDSGRAALRHGNRLLGVRRILAAFAHPARARALLDLLVFRLRGRRRSFRVARSGARTLAVLGGDERLRTVMRDPVPGFEPVVPPGGTRLQRYASLARRPAGGLLLEGGLDRLLARALGMQAIERD
jgi:hypothetical protein